MGKVAAKFRELKKRNSKAFVVYLPFGFPTIALTRDIILTLQDSNVDVIELGIPFSDPLADGAILQEASAIALQRGATTEALFSFLRLLRGKLKIPVVIMSYYNPLYVFGVNRFLKKARSGGISGIMVVDLPMEEAADFTRRARKLDLDTVFFITPTTSSQRARKILRLSRGFIYYISVTGITGPKDMKLGPIFSHIKALKKATATPVCVGFGIHTRAQAKKLETVSDGVIVGSIVAKYIKDNYKSARFLRKLSGFIMHLNPLVR